MRERLGDDWLAIDDGAQVQGRVIPPAVLERGVRGRRGRARRQPGRCSRRDVSVGAGTTVERAVMLEGAQHRRRLRRCATASSAAGCRVGAGTQITGGAVLGEGVSVGADNVITRGARIFPGSSCPTARSSSRLLTPTTTGECADLTGPRPQFTQHDRRRAADERRRRDRDTHGGELSRASIARVDVSDQLGDVLALPEHLRDALWRVESAIMQDWDTPAGLVVAGMGGSAIGGALARAALGDHASRPIFVTRAYGLPPWTTPDTMVLCASYSGRHRGDARVLRVGGRARRAGARS